MKIKIFHTNDIHSYLSNYKKISRFIQDKKFAADAVIYADIGDHVDRSHPLTEATLGQANTELLNESKVDVVTIGNNEGITLTFDDFNHLYDNAHFDVTCSNLYDFAGNLPRHIKRHVIQEHGGIKFGFIGATAEFTPFYKSLGWDVIEPMAAIEREVISIRDKVDVIVILSHLGKFFDRRIAEEIDGVDVILGAHTHHFFPEGERINDVLIGAAGRYGEYIGEVTLEFKERKIISKSAKLYDTLEIRNAKDDYYEQGKQLLSHPIKEREIDLPRRLFSASYTTALLARKIRAFVDADCAVINSGLIVRGYTGNQFTKYYLHSMLPHPINPVKVTLTGRELKEVINMSFQNEEKNNIVKGFGFRGDIFGMYVWDNIGFIQSQQKYFVNGELIDNHKKYTVATIDMYTFGRFFPQFVQCEKIYYTPEFLRDLMEEAVKEL